MHVLTSALATTPIPMRAALPSLSFALPTCAAEGVLSLAIKSGCVGVAAQLGLGAFFKASHDPVLNEAPHYTAHQIVAFALMVFVSALGAFGWITQGGAVAATATARILTPSPEARWLGAMLLGMLVAWDVPAAILIPRLRKPDNIVHHVAMAATALVGACFLPTRYGLYYMGVIELSSIPLTAYDLLERASETAQKDDSVPAARKQWLREARDACRTVAAVMFVLVRAFDFTRVTLSRFVPDAMSVLHAAGTAAHFKPPLRFMLGSSVGFVGLQLYWFSLFARLSLAERKREQRKKARSEETKATEDAP